MTTRTLAPYGDDAGDGTDFPIRTFERAEEILEDGDVLLIQPGHYVLTKEFMPPSGVTLEAAGLIAPVISGLNVQVDASAFTQNGTWHEAPWQPAWTTGIKDASTDRIDRGDLAAYREMIVVEGDPQPYLQVHDEADLIPGTFMVIGDTLHREPSQLRINFRGEKANVCLSTLAGLINVNDGGNAKADQLTVRGLILEYAACHYGSALIQTAPGKGGHSTFEHLEVRFSGSDGIRVGGEGNWIRSCTVHHNGRGDITGWHARTSIVERCRTHSSNWKGFRSGHGCGNKFGASRYNTFRHNHFGPSAHSVDGLWLDVNCHHNLIHGNIIEGVERGGVFVEWSEQNVITSNVITGVRAHKPTEGGSGIYLKEAPDNLVAFNTIFGCDRGIRIRQGGGRRAKIGEDRPFDTVRNLIVNNVVAFAELDAIHFDDPKRQLSREDLDSNRVNGNAYAALPGAPVFFKHSWEGEFSLDELDAWRQITGQDAHSFVLTDFRLFENSEEWQLAGNADLAGRAIEVPAGWFGTAVPTTDLAGRKRLARSAVGCVEVPGAPQDIDGANELADKYERLVGYVVLLRESLQGLMAVTDDVD